jgi:hypothetical protein
VRAAVDNPIHVEIQVVKLGQQGIVSDNLVNLGVALGNPAIKLFADDETWT